MLLWAVVQALDTDKNMLVGMHQKSGHPIAERIRKEYEIFTVGTGITWLMKLPQN